MSDLTNAANLAANNPLQDNSIFTIRDDVLNTTNTFDSQKRKYRDTIANEDKQAFIDRVISGMKHTAQYRFAEVLSHELSKLREQNDRNAIDDPHQVVKLMTKHSRHGPYIQKLEAHLIHISVVQQKRMKPS